MALTSFSFLDNDIDCKCYYTEESCDRGIARRYVECEEGILGYLSLDMMLHGLMLLEYFF